MYATAVIKNFSEKVVDIQVYVTFEMFSYPPLVMAIFDRRSLGQNAHRESSLSADGL
jgi:hypothetical protein